MTSPSGDCSRVKGFSFAEKMLTSLLSVFSLLLALAFAGKLGHAEIPKSVGITNVTVDGPGCPANTASAATVAMNADNTAFTVIYSNFSASADIGSEYAQLCKIRMTVRPPPGFSMAIREVDHRGFALIPDPVKAVQVTVYKFADDADIEMSKVRHVIQGPLFDDWQTTEVGDQIPSACSTSKVIRLTIVTRLKFKENQTYTQQNYITGDSTDVATNKSRAGTFKLDWHNC